MLRVSSGPEAVPSFAEVVDNVRTGHPDGLDQLYKVFRILSASLRRQIGFQDFDDRVHDMFIVVAEAIRDGKLREPSALPSYIYGVARLSLCSKIGVRTRRDRLSGSLRHWVSTHNRNHSPEEALAERERTQIMRQMLASLSAKEREILTRFYLYEQPKEQICQELKLTDTQFRLSKSRAKQRLSRMGEEYSLHGNAGSAYAA
jgi:RNA polymerase sigma-70 factor, ECF subfamily